MAEENPKSTEESNKCKEEKKEDIPLSELTLEESKKSLKENIEDVPLSELTCEEEKLRLRLSIKFKKFLYTCNDEGFYVSGTFDKHDRLTPKNITCIDDYIGSRFKRDCFRVLIEFANDTDFSQRETLFYVLGLFLKTNGLSQSFRNDVYQTALKLLKSDGDLFLLVKFSCNKPDGRKIPSGMQKIIRQYYSSKDPMIFASDIVKSKSFYGWSHKDLIKLSHWKTDNEVLHLIIQYVLFGLEKCSKMEIIKENAVAKEIYDLFVSSKELKASKDEKYISENLSKLNCSFQQVPATLNKSRLIWEVLIPAMPLLELVNFLPRMYKTGLLKQDSPTQKKVLEILKNDALIKSSKIHPVDLFIALRNYEKGGKPKDPQLIKYLVSVEESKKECNPNYEKKEIAAVEPVNKGTAVAGALYKAVMVSFGNIQATGKSIFITIDIAPRMLTNPCLTTKNLFCIEAAAILALSFVKAEKKVTIALFKQKTISIFPVEKGTNLYSLIKKLEEAHATDYVVLSAPIDWALSKNKKVDIFINMLNRMEFSIIPKDMRGKEVDHPMEKLTAYNTAMNTEARLINCFLGSHNNVVAGGDVNGLDINGFDSKVPKLINTFINNKF